MIKTFILSLSLLSTTLYASPENLDVHPQSQRELEKLIRTNKSELMTAHDAVLVASELNRDASRRTDLSRGVVIAGVVAVTAAPYIAGGIMAGAGAFESLSIGAIVGSLPGYINLIYDLDTIAAASGASVLRFKSKNYYYKYSEIYAQINDERAQILDQYFDGSLLNYLKNGATLGGVVDKGSFKLLINAITKEAFLKEEARDLGAFQN